MAHLWVMESRFIPQGDLILFDGTCVFCSAFARFIVRHDRAGHFRFVMAHSPLWQAMYRAHGLDPVAITTNIVITDGITHVKLRAFTAAMRRCGGWAGSGGPLACWT